MTEFNPGSANSLNEAVKARYEANSDTNVFTDAEKAKLQETNIFSSSDKAKLDQTSIFTSSEKSKLSGLDASDYATAAQGVKADTAVQPGTLATVATTGQYSDLLGTPSFSGALSDLSDVDASVQTPSDGDILVYRAIGSDWILEAKPAGGSNPSAADITDATADGIAILTSSDANPFTNSEKNTLNALAGKTLVESNTAGISGADAVTNIVSLTQAEYDAITPLSSTFYLITDA